jgi:chemotaxis response regulator CheB
MLVVDDFADWRHCVIENLREDRSLQVIGVASDGLVAVLKAEQLQPDLILLDIGLPKLDGSCSTDSQARARGQNTFSK